jgi:hypothetical protein
MSLRPCSSSYPDKSVLGMYRSLLFQLLEKFPDLFESLGATVPNFDRCSIEVVKDTFGCAVENLGQRSLACFIDALDECEDDEVSEMLEFFEGLGRVAVASDIPFRICFSSRHYPHITIEKAVYLTLEGQEGHQQDMANYLNSELKAGHSKLVEQIRDEILERASGIFMWVVLVVRILNEEFRRGRIHALRKRLNEIPDRLNDLFHDILTRDSQNIDEMILCLQWILFARRPLKREEFYFALLSGDCPNALSAWDPEEVTEEDIAKYVLSSSKGLAEMTKSKAQTVQFIHESVKDFLLKGNGLDRLQSHLSSNFTGLSHHRLKECCQNYLRVDIPKYLSFSEPLPAANSQEGKNLRQLASERFPFLEYAVRNILYHADTAGAFGVPQNAFVENFFI